VKKYLESSNLDTSDETVRNLIFDVEVQKVGIPIAGLQWFELEHSNLGSNFSFTASALEMIATAKKDKNLFNQIVDDGLYATMFKNQNETFAATFKKCGKNFPFFDPKFFEPRAVESTYDFVLKDEFRDKKEKV